MAVIIATQSYGGFGSNAWSALSFAMLFRLLAFSLQLALLWRWIAVALLGTITSIAEHVTLVSHGQYKTSIQPMELVIVSVLIFSFLFAVVETVEYLIRKIHKTERKRNGG